MRCCLRDPMFCRFSRTPACDGHGHGHVQTDTGPRLVPRMHIASRGKNTTTIKLPLRPRGVSTLSRLVPARAGRGWRRVPPARRALSPAASEVEPPPSPSPPAAASAAARAPPPAPATVHNVDVLLKPATAVTNMS